MRRDPTPVDRRGFLLGVAGGLGLLVAGPDDARAVPHVVATPTIFFSPPDGRTALVRFVVDGSEAPAGRMRVYDQARRLVGTAGVINVGGRLYGELWLPLEREAGFSTDLELPGVRGIIRSAHRLAPRPRWTLRWITLAPPIGLDGAEYLEHAAFLATPGTQPPDAVVALEPTGSGAGLSTLPLLLAGVGVRWLVRRDSTPGPVTRRLARDGSAVTVVAIPAGSTPDDLGFFQGRDEISRRVERFIDSSGALQPAGTARPEALVVGTGAGDIERAGAQVEEWNARFAWPRIAVGGWDEFAARIPAPGAEAPAPRPPRPPPEAAPRAAVATAREDERRARVARLLAPLVSRLTGTGTGLARVAEQFAFRSAQTLVVNPAPFTRTDLAVMPDGTERVVRDVPASGFLCVPAADPAFPDARWRPVEGNQVFALENRTFAVEVDATTGALRSVTARAGGREWVRAGGGGWNACPGAGLAGWALEINPAAGRRLVLDRGVVRSTVTVYDDLPWIDIENQWPGAEPPAYRFPVALDGADASWEIPAGFDAAPVPVPGFAHLRWVRLQAGADAFLLRAMDAADAAVDGDGTLTSFAPAGRSRYRFTVSSGFSLPDDAPRFGWSAEPLVTTAVPGTGGATLASYGSMILVDQSGIAVLDFRPARDGDGVIVLLQELLGGSRDITLGPGLLAFTGGRRVDFLERDLGPLPDLGGRGLAVPLAGYGITAVRLTGVGLAGG